MTLVPDDAPATAGESVHAQGTFDLHADLMTGWWRSYALSATVSCDGWVFVRFEYDWIRVTDGVEERGTSTVADNPAVGPDVFSRRYLLEECDVRYYASEEDPSPVHVTQTITAFRAVFADTYLQTVIAVEVCPSDALQDGCAAAVNGSSEATHRGPPGGHWTFDLKAQAASDWVFRRWKGQASKVSKEADLSVTVPNGTVATYRAYFCPVTGLVYCDESSGCILAGSKNDGKILFKG